MNDPQNQSAQGVKILVSGYIEFFHGIYFPSISSTQIMIF